jgi:hypothetical protein
MIEAKDAFKPVVPAGMVSLPHCIGYLAARQGDDRLVQPVSIYKNMETGELRYEPELPELQATWDAYTDLVLFMLRAGYLVAYVDGSDHVLSPEFWQYPVARQSLLSGCWDGHRLLASREELEELVGEIIHRSTMGSQDEALPAEPDPEAVIEPAAAKPERRGAKPKDYWPKVLGYAAGWLNEMGKTPNTQAELERVIVERIESLGGSASSSTVRGYAREMLQGYQQQLDDE